MAFETHVFISYAHIDNQPLTPEQQGWVSRFHASLEAMLSMRIGRKAEIWRDKKLTGNDIFAQEIVEQLPNTAVLVSVLTPRYMESDWCTREVREFCKVAEQSGGLVLDNKARVIKVIKTPVENEDSLPDLVKQMLGYEFYTFIDEAPLELDPAFGPEVGQKYTLKLAKVAWDIAQLLKKLEATAQNGNSVCQLSSCKPAIYLAECGYDHRDAREAVEGELRRYGFKILPQRQLPREEADYIAEVTRLLEQCKLSIHLVGSSYGAVPDGPSQKSVVILQNELAIQRSKSAGLQRVIWLPDGTRSEHSEQQGFIEALQKDVQAQTGADLITSDLETLKGVIHSALRRIERRKAPIPAQTHSPDSTKLVYLVCDERDRATTVPLRKFLKGQALDVKIPVFEGDAATVRQAGQDLLTECDAAIVFYGAGGEAWKRMVESDLKRVNAFRAEKPRALKYTYLAEPGTADKADLIELDEANLINGLEGFSQAKLEPFLQAIKQA